MKVCLQCNAHFEDKFEFCPDDGAWLIATGNDPMIGTVIGDRYKIIYPVGSGSVGIVYKAIQQSSGREMAVKVLKNFHDQDEALVKRFRREAKTASTLKHPNIVTLFDFGLMDNGQPYIVTEFLKGITLAHFLRDQGSVSTLLSRHIIKQVCDAVSEAHANQIVHRDLKPENIVLQLKDQGGHFVKVVDFGIAKMIGGEEAAAQSASLTLEGRVCGSPGYMSPEQCRSGVIDYRCDIYSLGIVIFEMLTGKRPFIANDVMSLMFMHVSETPPRLASAKVDPAFTPELEAVIRKALSKEPGARQQSVEQLWNEFNAACQGEVLKKDEPQDKWIPFASVEAPKVKYVPLTGREEVVDLVGVSTEHRRIEAARKRSVARKRSQFFWLKTAVVVATSAGMVAGYWKYQKSRSAVEVAQSLSNGGRPEDAVRVLESLHGRGNPTNDEMLNSDYIQAAIKYGKKRRYDLAIEMLERVAAQSKHKSEALDLIRKFHRRS